ncbi:MAG: serine/threonine-protein kinase KIN2 [Chrysothrix sp. TS-e1954]|nr:MAG: serine/threonine-protein kinase KIN2 [Chrysothrix sp. TS-e1954]
MSAPTSPPSSRGGPPSSHRDHASRQSDVPSRSQSVNVRNAPSSPLPHRANSVQQGAVRPPSSSRQAHQLASVARRDFEQSNVAQVPSSPRRSSSVDRHIERKSSQAETTKSGQQTPSRSRHSRYNSEVSNDGTPRINGASADPVSQPNATQAPRRRTAISAPTGQWNLGKTIGAGSMGKVKLARNVDTGETVAVKIVPRLSQDDHRSQQDRERAEHSKEVRTAREAAIVTLMSHPYICGMRDVVRTNYHWYMLFEYVNGGQMLDYIISHGRLKEKPARKFARQIASALDYCHRNSVVHRDLKIENILISKTGDIKIIDFGLSNLFSPRSQLKTFCGSLYFAAPELLQAKQYTGPEVDIWSFGIVLYVLVCGKVPFDDQSMPQLHAKIKKGAAEYPPWLSTECRHIISRMLVTDPSKRASLSEIMNHPWMTKGFNGPPENYLPQREPLQMPLDSKILEKMTGFDFGSTDYITRQLENVMRSEEYQRAVRHAGRKGSQYGDADKKKSGMFDFYQRRKSAGSRDALATPSSEAVQYGDDPVNAFSPLISIYYLVREKQEREQREENPGAFSIPRSPGEKPLQLPDLPAPEAAYTNAAAYEMAGEAPTGGRSRPRARTHGEDDVAEDLHKPAGKEAVPSRSSTTTPLRAQPSKRESTTAGLLRRFSTRKHREPEPEKQKLISGGTPSVAVSTPEGAAGSARQSVNVRRTRDRETPPSAFQNVANNHPDLLAPPESPRDSPGKKLRGLGRSASVNSADLRRRFSRRSVADPTALKSTPVSESEKSSIAEKSGKPVEDLAEDAGAQSDQGGVVSRSNSTRRLRRESTQTRRLRRDRTRDEDVPQEVPEETDQELAEETSGVPRNGESQDTLKPIYLKGLFSVATTSGKPLSFIRSDLIRVLKQLNVEYREMKSGFSCRQVPSIEMNKTPVDPAAQEKSFEGQTHRRKISFAGLRSNERSRAEHQDSQKLSTPNRTGRRAISDSVFNSEEESEDDNAARRQARSPRVAGATSTRIQDDMGKSLITKFEILVVKIPIVSMHGIQFKKVDGGMWQYKTLADMIVQELRL